MKIRVLSISVLTVVLLLSISCEVEQIQPNELSNSNTTDPNAEAYTTPPCALDSNVFKFVFNYDLKKIRANNSDGNIPKGCVNASYILFADMHSDYDGRVQSLEMYFLSEPKTGKYYVVPTDTLDPNSKTKNVYISVAHTSGYSTNHYTTEDSTIVYVNNSNGKIKFSFCESKFASSIYDYKSNCKAQLTLVK